MASIAANSVQFLVNGRENGMGTDTQFSMSEIAKGGWQSDRIKRLRLRVARSKRKAGEGWAPTALVVPARSKAWATRHITLADPTARVIFQVQQERAWLGRPRARSTSSWRKRNNWSPRSTVYRNYPPSASATIRRDVQGVRFNTPKIPWMGRFLLRVFHWPRIRVFATALSVRQGTMVLYRGGSGARY